MQPNQRAKGNDTSNGLVNASTSKLSHVMNRLPRSHKHGKFKTWFIRATAFLLLIAAMLSHATEKGLFWEMVSPSGQVSYLFGTIHTDDNRVTDFSPKVLAALKSVDLFVMETQPNANPSNFNLPEGSLDTVLSEAELTKVAELADFYVLHLEQVLKMKPWLLAFVFSQAKPQTPFAQDNLLMRQAEDFGKPIRGLETSEEHFGVMDDFSQTEQLTMLRSVLKLTQEEKERGFEKLIGVYLAGDSDALLQLDEEITGSNLPEALWAKMRVKLLDERNALMAERAVNLIQNQPTFIAVGAAHLASEGGLINTFQKAGFQLTRIDK